MLRVTAVARALGVHPDTVRRWVKRGEITHARYGRCPSGDGKRGGTILIPEWEVTQRINRVPPQPSAT